MMKIEKTTMKILGILAVSAGLLLIPVRKADAQGWFGFNFGFYDPGSGVSVSVGAPGYYIPAPVYPVIVPEPYVVYRPAVVVPRVIGPAYYPAHHYPKYKKHKAYRSHRWYAD